MLYAMGVLNVLSAFIIAILIPFYFSCIEYAEMVNAAFLPLRSSSLGQNILTATIFGITTGQVTYSGLIALQFFLLSISTFDPLFSRLS